MKRKLISFLVMTLLVVNTTMVQAATTDSTGTTSTDNVSSVNTTKVSLENIEEIMTENNLDMKSAYNTLQIAEQTFKKAKETADDYDEDTLKDEYDAAEDAYENYDGTDDTEKAELKSAASTAQNCI